MGSLSGVCLIRVKGGGIVGRICGRIVRFFLYLLYEIFPGGSLLAMQNGFSLKNNIILELVFFFLLLLPMGAEKYPDEFSESTWIIVSDCFCVSEWF